MANAVVEHNTPHVYNVKDVSRSELEQVATRLVRGAMCLTVRDHIAMAAPADWETGTLLLDSEDPYMQQIGVQYLLGALANTPNNARDLAQQVLGELKRYTAVDVA